MQRETVRYSRGAGDALKGVIAGAVGGLVASFAMNEFQSFLSEASGAQNSRAKQEAASDKKSAQGQQSPQRKEAKESGGAGDEPATVKAAEAISENLFNHKLTKAEKKPAGEAMHYAMGAFSGAIYGALAELAPVSAVGAGLPFGAAVWMVADNIAAPAFGLSKPPTEYPLSTHAYALASHLVYGLTTDLVRRALRAKILK